MVRVFGQTVGSHTRFAMGLVAAIPAVVAYNYLSNDMGRYANRLEGFAEEFGTILSRQMDEEHH